MATSTQQDRAATTDARAREWLAAGNTRAALHRVWDALRAEVAELRDADPARADLVVASLTGALMAQVATLATAQPRRPPGYNGGPPSADDLLHAYETGRNQTSRQR